MWVWVQLYCGTVVEAQSSPLPNNLTIAIILIRVPCGMLCLEALLERILEIVRLQVGLRADQVLHPF